MNISLAFLIAVAKDGRAAAVELTLAPGQQANATLSLDPASVRPAPAGIAVP